MGTASKSCHLSPSRGLTSFRTAASADLKTVRAFQRLPLLEVWRNDKYPTIAAINGAAKKHLARTKSPLLTRETERVPLPALYSREMKSRLGVLGATPPGPAFSDVVMVEELAHQLVLMAICGAKKIARVAEDENKLLGGPKAGKSAHARLIVSRAVMDKRNSVTVKAVESHHLVHARS